MLDAITPAPVEVDYPTLLPLPAPRLWVYPKETVVAETCEAMVKLGIANSRMKDFYDLWSLACSFEFEGSALARAMKETFARRRTDAPAKPPVALTPAFSDDAAKRQQWNGFLRRNRLSVGVAEFPEIIALLASFLLPVLEASSHPQEFRLHWFPGGSWRARPHLEQAIPQPT